MHKVISISSPIMRVLLDHLERMLMHCVATSHYLIHLLTTETGTPVQLDPNVQTWSTTFDQAPASFFHLLFPGFGLGAHHSLVIIRFDSRYLVLHSCNQNYTLREWLFPQKKQVSSKEEAREWQSFARFGGGKLLPPVTLSAFLRDTHAINHRPFCPPPTLTAYTLLPAYCVVHTASSPMSSAIHPHSSEE